MPIAPPRSDEPVQGTRALRLGFKRGLPVMLGIVPFGIAYGAAAAKTLHWSQGLGMSALVFAGTAQFIATELLSQGATTLSVVATVVLVNLRFVLLGSALSPVLKRHRPALQALMSFFIVDESFAVASLEYENSSTDGYFLVGAGLSTWVVWQISSAIGIFVGPLIPGGFGLEFALSASFIGLLALMIRTKQMALIALASLIVSASLSIVLGSTWGILVSAIIVATLGVIWERFRAGS